MSENSNSGILPFDPRHYGPIDIYRDTAAWVSKRDRELLAVGTILLIALIGIHARYGIEIEIPRWAPVMIGSSVASMLIGIYPVRRVVEVLWDSENIPIVILDAGDGDLGVIEVSPTRFRDMRVIDHDGDEHDSSFLREIQLASGSRAYEVDHYHPDRNVAICSWMSGATNRDIRRHKHSVRYLKEQLSKEADKSLDALVNAPEVLREQGAVIANSMIRTAEGVDTPTEESTDIYDKMWSRVEETDKSEELLADRGLDDDFESALSSWIEEQDGLDPMSNGASSETDSSESSEGAA
jgi:hypothetical protein